ncbi:DUF58 domain-containing protein [Paenibacillus sp. GCM10027626]|uniref:DUF58 domain-containing protein n=1 Tax=Paenibacillus sp. GCM10027626 TaxID=3273411 RepID=UPI0036357DB5
MFAAIKTMARWKIIALIYLICLLFLLFQGGKTAFMLFCIFNALVIYLIIGRWSGIGKVSGSRKLGQEGAAQDHTLVAGMRLDVQLNIKIPGIWPIPFVLVRERLIRANGGELPFEASYVPRYRGAGAVSYKTPPLERGNYHFAATVCSTQDIFGLFEHKGAFDNPAPFSVYPQIVPIRDWQQFRSGGKGPYSTTAIQRSAKETTQINGVREYIYGDRLSRIHWNATAKTGQWKSKEFERESLPRTIFVLDRYEAGYGNGAAFELAVSAAASMIQFAFKRSASIGLLSAGSDGMMPEQAPNQLQLIMNHLVRVQPDGQVPLYRMLRQSEGALPYGAFVVIISPQQGEEAILAMEWLARRGAAPLLIHVQDGHAAADNGGGAVNWMQLLRRGGIAVHSIGSLQELPAALEGGK